MKKYILFILILNSCISNKNIQTTNIQNSNFIKVNGRQFELNGSPYKYMGTNFWAGMNLGSLKNGGNRNRLINELDKMKEIGITNIRIMALTEGPNSEPYRIIPSNNNKGELNEDLLVGLDFLLVEMKKRNQYAVVCLSNFWPWSGGFAQYLKWTGEIDNIHYPMDTTKTQSWDFYQKETIKFFSSKKSIELYNTSIDKIINRKNSISNLNYKNDATIMSWELCNEPRGLNNVEHYLKWIDNTAQHIKQIDSNHLITVGSEGFTPYKSYAGTPFLETHSSNYIDYTTAHLWIQNWDWYNPKNHESTIANAKLKSIEYLNEHIEISKKLNKPFVLEEFGISKDNGSFNYTAPTKNRDQFYSFVFDFIYKNALQNNAAGVNFWAWAGEGRPKYSGSWWKVNDDFTGDPPHEQQGWYSVYDLDSSTHKIIKKYAGLMQNVK